MYPWGVELEWDRVGEAGSGEGAGGVNGRARIRGAEYTYTVKKSDFVLGGTGRVVSCAAGFSLWVFSLGFINL